MQYFPGKLKFCYVEMERKTEAPFYFQVSKYYSNALAASLGGKLFLIHVQIAQEQDCSGCTMETPNITLPNPLCSCSENPCGLSSLKKKQVIPKTKSFLLPPSDVALLERAAPRPGTCLWLQVAACQAGFFFATWMNGWPKWGILRL